MSKFTDKVRFEDCMTQWVVQNGKVPDLVVSGGAAGADTLAEWWARKNNIPIKVFIPDWKRYGKAAGILRNTDIVAACTHMIAFPSKMGKGTQDSIRKAWI